MKPHRTTALSALFIVVLLTLSVNASADEAKSPPDWTAEIARAFEKAMAAGDVEALQTLCDNEGFVEDVMKSVDGSPGFKQGVRDSLNGSLTQVFVRTAMLAERYTLLHVRTHEGQPSALFRVLSETNGFSYQELLFKTLPDGQHKVADAYIAAAGEPFSSTLKRLISLGNAQVGQGEGDAYVTNVRALTLANREGRYQDALDVFDAMSDDLKRDKGLQIIRMMSATKVDDEALEKAGNDFRTQFPDDPAANLMLVDYYMSKKDREKTRQCLDGLRDYSGGDAYVEFLAGVFAKSLGETDNARQAYERSLTIEPTLEDPQWALLQLALEKKDHKETAARLRKLEELGVEFDPQHMRTAPTYADFVTTPEFEAWLKDYERAHPPVSATPDDEE